MPVTVRVVSADIATVEADALMVAIDARLRVPGGVAWRTYLASIDREERTDVAAFAEEDIRALTLRDGEAAAIPAHGRYDTLIVAAALLHEVNGVAPSNALMLEVLGHAAQSAASRGSDAGVRAIAATVIGDRRAGLAHNHPMSSAAAVETMARGFGRSNAAITVLWCIPDEHLADHARQICAHLRILGA